MDLNIKMNIKQKEKAFRDEQIEIQEYLTENDLFYTDYSDTNQAIFCAGRIGYRRTRCGICKGLIDIGECFAHPNWTFIRNNRETDMHLKCFYNAVQNDLNEIENWVKFIELNANDKDFSFKEMEK